MNVIEALSQVVRPSTEGLSTDELLDRGMFAQARTHYTDLQEQEAEEVEWAAERLYGFRMCTQNKARKLAALSREQVIALLRAGEKAVEASRASLRLVQSQPPTD